jgi:DNA replication and repair protein RecF
MRLLALHLEEFRCYSRLDLDFPSDGVRLFGENASGKTSLLEAITILSTTRSPRASIERELIRFDSVADLGLPPYARIVGRIAADHDETSVEISLSATNDEAATTKKRIRIDGQARRAVDAVGRLKVVLFQPEDLDLVLGSPSIRRRYMDVLLATVDTSYLRTLSQYGRILEQRNSLLKRLRDRAGRSNDARGELEYWDTELMSRAAYLTTRRVRYLVALRDSLSAYFSRLAGEAAPQVEAHYDARFGLSPDSYERIGKIESQAAQRLVQHELERALKERREEELRRGVTVIGPHRDDFVMTVGGRNLSAFGSRGQQRLGVVALKLAEMDAVRRLSGEAPVLLLDDVLSELDEARRRRLLDLVSAAECQTIVTATDRGLLETPVLKQLPLLHVVGGTVRPAEE